MQLQHTVSNNNITFPTIIPQKSPNDLRQYQAVTLSNNLRLLLIYDPSIQKSACSISVGIGSLADPSQSLGLAHFLQHMLFMGSTNYPIHNQYSSFINLNSGMDNAYTSDTQTNYYFQISNQVFIQAIKRLTNFFTGALLSEQCINKQTQAVHEEYVLWTNDDNCRKWEILRKLASGPYKRFSIGNKQTLGHPQIRNHLVKFYQQQYSANRINAVLCSNLQIQQMKRQLLKYFQQIPDKNLTKLSYEPSYLPENTGKLIRMQSIKQQTIIQFFFPLQSLKPHYKKHFDEYITHILGHQGKNSLFSYLKNLNYASSITSYSHDIGSQTIIGLQIKLTPQGYSNEEKISQIYNIVIDYISSLKPSHNIYQQIRTKSQLTFQFKQKTQTYQYVCDLSSKMHHIKLEQILNGKYIFDEYTQEYQEKLNKILKQLNPFNLIVVLSSSEEIEEAQQEKYLGGKFKIVQLPKRKIQVEMFQQLENNTFLPVNIQLKSVKEQLNQSNNNNITPIQLSQKPNILFLPSSTFKVCKGGCLIFLQGMSDPILRQFYSQYLNLLLKQLTYSAQTLQLSIQYNSQSSIQIQIFGFSDTVTKLISKIGQSLVSIHSSQHSQKYFIITHEKLLQDYQNFYCNQVDEIAQTMLENIIINQNKNIQQTIEILEQYQYEHVKGRIMEFLKQCKINWVFVGNFDQEETVKLVKQFQNNVKSTQSKQNQDIKCLRIQYNNINNNINDNNNINNNNNSIKHLTQLQSQQISTSCCIVYYQAGQYTQQLYYTLQLLKNHIQEPFFNQLRTQRQFAYYLATKIINNRGILALQFILVSSSKDPSSISLEIKQFVSSFMSKINKQITQQKLLTLKQSIKTKFSTPHNNLYSLFTFTIKQIKQSTFYFTRKNKNQLDLYLNKIDQNDMIQLWEKIKQKCLEIHVLAKNHKEMFDKIQNVQHNYKEFDEIKKQANYYDDIVKNRNKMNKL